MSVILEPYNSNHFETLKNMHLPEEQLYYTEMPSASIEIAEGDPTRQPVTIMADGEPVGMFVLQSGPRVKEFTHHKDALLLIAYMIDHAQQGKGYAADSLHQLPGYIKEYFPETDYVVLAVNEKNNIAQNLYKKCNFQDKGERKLGKKGWLLILEQCIEKNK